MDIEEGSETRELEWKKIRTAFMVEVKKVVTIAAPMVASSMLQNLLQVVSIIMVGHINQLSLSSVSIATSITNVSGFSILVSPLSSLALHYIAFEYSIQGACYTFQHGFIGY